MHEHYKEPEFIDELKVIMDGARDELATSIFPHEKELRGVILEPDMVNHPPHYTCHRVEAIDIIDDYFIDNYYLGQVFKYTARAGKKNDELEDLKKAQFYLNRYIEIREGALK
jgi:hypothetical protein